MRIVAFSDPNNNNINKCIILALAMYNIINVIKKIITVDPKSGCNNSNKEDIEKITTGIIKTLIL